MGKGSLSFRRLPRVPQRKKGTVAERSMPSSPPLAPPINMGGKEKPKKKSGVASSRQWMMFDRSGVTEVVKCDKSTIIKRASLPARDLRIIGPLFSHSSNILRREKAIVINLEVIKAIVTANEVMLLLDPLLPDVITLIDRLKLQFSSNVQCSLDPEDLQSELSFEIQVLDIVLDVVCSFDDRSFASLEIEAWSLLDELIKNASAENLENVRSLKSKLTHLLARVQKVRNAIEHLLDDDEDMADLYLTRKCIQNQQTDVSNSIVSMVTRSNTDVEDLEILLEAYFIQLEGMRNKILMVRKHIEDTEKYVKIQKKNHRNRGLQQKLRLTIASLAIAAGTLVVSLFGMNIPIPLYNTTGAFGYVVWSVVVLCVLLLMVVFGYVTRKKLL